MGYARTGKELVEWAVRRGLIVRPAVATVKQRKGLKKRLEAATERSKQLNHKQHTAQVPEL